MYPKPDSWTICFPDGDLGKVTHSTPSKLWQDLTSKHWTLKNWTRQKMSFAHVRWTRTGFTVRLFKTLAAARRFHKTLRHPA